jgi:uncharacterized protein with HEPN domain
MSFSDDRVRLHHMLDAANKAIKLTRGKTRLEFEADEVLTLAIVRLVEIIGEAAKYVSSETKDRYSNIPWRQMAGTRDRLIHAYFDVNLNIVWQIVSQELQPLVKQVEYILSDRNENSAD